MENIIDFGVISLIVVGLVQVVKVAGLPKKLLPVSAIVFGVILAFIWGFGTIPYSVLVIEGLIAGLSAMGLFSGMKTSIKG